MTSPLVLVVELLKASAAVGAIVADRIEPEVARGSTYPRVVVRQSGSRQHYALGGSVPLREGRVTVICGAQTFTEADRLASVVVSALKDIRHAPVAGQRVTVRQDGDDTGTWDDESKSYQRIVGFKVSVSGG